MLEIANQVVQRCKLPISLDCTMNIIIASGTKKSWCSRQTTKWCAPLQKGLADSLTVKQYLDLEKLLWKPCMPIKLFQQVFEVEVGDPSIYIKARDWVITVTQAQKHHSITYLNFTRTNSWMQIWIVQRPCGYYQSPCCAPVRCHWRTQTL